MKTKWSVWSAAALGSLIAAAWIYWKILESGVPWIGDGAAYNGGRLGGGILMGGLIGALIAWLRNRFFV